MSSATVLKGIVHGKTIELEQEPGLPDGQEVSVVVQPLEATKKRLPPGEGIQRSAGGWGGRRRRVGRVSGMESPAAESRSAGDSGMSFLLDTDTCSVHLKQKGNLTHRFLQQMGRLHLSVLTLGEWFTWALRAKASPQRLQSLLDFVNDVQVLEVTEPVARKFGKVRAALLDAGRPVPEMDLLIAATALVHNLTVVTHNTRDYANIPGLNLDDWLMA